MGGGRTGVQIVVLGRQIVVLGGLCGAGGLL